MLNPKMTIKELVTFIRLWYDDSAEVYIHHGMESIPFERKYLCKSRLGNLYIDTGDNDAKTKRI
jgi:hypothetical protein